ncbi:MAG: hypothetical protein JF606_24515 [Burkholderiales bacterium]|jgi:hypothetical protein|nr:hypothetical protein [Burkholderiales bacterium]
MKRIHSDASSAGAQRPVEPETSDEPSPQKRRLAGPVGMPQNVRQGPEVASLAPNSMAPRATLLAFRSVGQPTWPEDASSSSSGASPSSRPAAGTDNAEGSETRPFPLNRWAGDLQERIARALNGSDTYETFKDLHSLKMTCKELRDVIDSDRELRYDNLRRRVEEANSIVRDAPDFSIMSNMDPFARMRRLLSPSMRQRLITLAAADPTGAGLKKLTPKIDCFDKGQRDTLVKAVIQLGAEMDRGQAIGGFGKAFAHLDRAQQMSLIQAAVTMNDDHEKASCISDLLKGAAVLEIEDRKVLLDTALNLNDQEARAIAIDRIAPHMIHLDHSERRLMVEKAFEMTDAASRAWALGGIAEHLEHLLPLPVEPEDVSRDRIFDAILTIVEGEEAAEEDLAHALNGLCQSMAHLDPLQRMRLVDIVIGMADESVQAEALCGFEMAFLDAQQQDRAIAAVEHMADDEDKSTALRGLMSCIGHLSGAQRERLLVATIELDEDIRGYAMTEIYDAAPHLEPSQIDRLIAAAISINDHNSKAFALIGLASCVQHLNTPQVNRLLQATSRLNDERDMVFPLITMIKHQDRLEPAQANQLFAIVNGLRTAEARLKLDSCRLVPEDELP